MTYCNLYQVKHRQICARMLLDFSFFFPSAHHVTHSRLCASHTCLRTPRFAGRVCVSFRASRSSPRPPPLSSSLLVVVLSSSSFSLPRLLPSSRFAPAGLAVAAPRTLRPPPSRPPWSPLLVCPRFAGFGGSHPPAPQGERGYRMCL